MLLITIPLLNAALFGDQLDRDPIVETQTKTVAVTDEYLKNSEKKMGAPAPSFRLLTDTSQFFVGQPFAKNESGKLEEKKKRSWSLFNDEEIAKDAENPKYDDNPQASDKTNSPYF